MKKTIGVLALVDAGKTAFSEQVLYHTKSIKTRGRVDHKNSFLDSHDIEKKRGITVFSDQAVFDINDSTYYSKNYSVYTNILAKYINQHDYESNQISSYIYNYIKKEYPATNPNFELTDTDKQNILINVKKHYPNSKLSDYEILDLININSVGIMVEQIEQLH